MRRLAPLMLLACTSPPAQEPALEVEISRTIECAVRESRCIAAEIWTDDLAVCTESVVTVACDVRVPTR